MKKNKLRTIGLLIMAFAHPVGYFFWQFVILGPLAYAGSYPYEVTGALIGTGILEFFFLGLALFIVSFIQEHKE